MSMIAILLVSSLVTVLAVIGLADAFTHLLCRAARSLRQSSAIDGRVEMAQGERLVA